MSNKWFSKEGRIATKEDCNAPWNGNKKNFRCGLCGYKFHVGDRFRLVFTNDMPNAHGNPLICDSCFTTQEDVRHKWAEKHEEYRQLKNNFWWFFSRNV